MLIQAAPDLYHGSHFPPFYQGLPFIHTILFHLPQTHPRRPKQENRQQVLQLDIRSHGRTQNMPRSLDTKAIRMRYRWMLETSFSLLKSIGIPMMRKGPEILGIEGKGLRSQRYERSF